MSRCYQQNSCKKRQLWLILAMEVDLVGARGSAKWSNMADVGVGELCQLVGERMRAHRIRIARTRTEIASSAGLSLRTYRRLEATDHGSIESLIAVLQAMGRVTAVAILFPEATLCQQHRPRNAYASTHFLRGQSENEKLSCRRSNSRRLKAPSPCGRWTTRKR
jgi:hypothetical protein